MATLRNSVDKLLSLKKELEIHKAQRLELQGELKSLNKQMEEDYGVKTLPQAEKLMEKLDKKLQEKEKSIKHRIQEIEELMG
jgi:predicted  nucleic acid-binding Zn-ribbon protein